MFETTWLIDPWFCKNATCDPWGAMALLEVNAVALAVIPDEPVNVQALPVGS